MKLFLPTRLSHLLVMVVLLFDMTHAMEEATATQAMMIDQATVIPGQYIVFYKDNADRIATSQWLFFSSKQSSESVRVVHELHKGVAVKGITDEQYQALLQDTSVEKVVQDFRITYYDNDIYQHSPPNWGLDRIDQATLPLDDVVDQKRNNPSQPMVINMSLGFPGVEHEFQKAVNAVAAGIVVVVAAGNEGADACSISPAFVKNAISVGASDWNDRRAPFSNYGPCVDVYAPGVEILSAFMFDDTASLSASGTSASAPHVAGAAALYLQAHPEWTPAQVWNAMKKDAAKAIQKRRLSLRDAIRFRRTNDLLLQTQKLVIDFF